MKSFRCNLWAPQPGLHPELGKPFTNMVKNDKNLCVISFKPLFPSFDTAFPVMSAFSAWFVWSRNRRTQVCSWSNQKLPNEYPPRKNMINTKEKHPTRTDLSPSPYAAAAAPVAKVWQLLLHLGESAKRATDLFIAMKTSSFVCGQNALNTTKPL